MEITLLITIVLVVVVIFLFLRNVRATLIPSAVIPLALLATAAVMLPLHFSLDNLSLMALTIAVGFVVDDAIVMVEVIWQRIEHGEEPFEAALDGAGEIGFTILTISISLIAVFTPLMFMGGVVGRLMREFALTLSAAVVVSMVLSLTLTPMLCGQFLQPPEAADATAFIRRWSAASRGWRAATPAALDVVLRHMLLTLVVFLATMAAGGRPLRHRADRLLPAAGHRLHQRRRGDLAGRLVRQDRAARSSRSADVIAQRSRRRRRRLLRRQRRRQPGQHQHHA